MGGIFLREMDRSVSENPLTVTTNHSSPEKRPLGHPSCTMEHVLSVPSWIGAFCFRSIPLCGSVGAPEDSCFLATESLVTISRYTYEHTCGGLPLLSPASHRSGKEPSGSHALGRLPDQPPVGRRISTSGRVHSTGDLVGNGSGNTPLLPIDISRVRERGEEEQELPTARSRGAHL